MNVIADWYSRYCALAQIDVLLIRQQIERLEFKPLLSLLTPVYNTNELYLRKCLDSVLAQLYPYWELCLCDNASEPATSAILQEYVAKDKRIKITRLEENQGGWGGTNAALDISSGDFIGFLDSDDEISNHALYLVADKINECPDTNWIYTDEAIIDKDSNCIAPFCKPDYAPDLFLSEFYMSHLSMYKAPLIKRFRLRYAAGSHDYDLALRVSEVIPPTTIKHIPVLAYKYRKHAESVAANTESYCIEGAMQSLQEHLDRIGRKATVTTDWPHYRVQYQLDDPPHVDILIASLNKQEILETCLMNLWSKTDYVDYSVILCVPQAVQQKITTRFGAWVDKGKIKFAPRNEDIPFNYSVLANSMSRVATGPILCFFNDDLESINSHWLHEMVSLAVHPETGAVGAMLLYIDLLIQHAGCILGLEQTAAHIYKKQPKFFTGYFGRGKLIGNYSMVTGACMVVRKEVYDQVGGYDENFQVAYGDVDLCVKMLKAGYHNAFNPYATLFHLESFTRGVDSTPEQNKRLNKERQMLIDRWGPLLMNDPMYNPNLSLNSYLFELVRSLEEIRYKRPWLK